MNNNSKMQIRESLAVEVDGTTVQGNRGYLITRMTLLATVAIVCCLLFGSGLLIYHFASCEEHHHASLSQHTTVCEHQHSHQHEHQLASNHLDTVSPVSPPVSTSSPIHTVAPNDTGLPELQARVPTSDASEQSSSSTSDGNTVLTSSGVREDLRLPRSIEPVAYDIRLVPWLMEDNFTFHGTVKIVVNVLEDCDNVTLHAAALVIHEVTIGRWLEGGEKSQPNAGDHGGAMETEVKIDRNLTIDSKQFYVLMLKAPLRKGDQCVVWVRYEGVLNNYLQGFYRSSYTANNETR